MDRTHRIWTQHKRTLGSPGAACEWSCITRDKVWFKFNLLSDNLSCSNLLSGRRMTDGKHFFSIYISSSKSCLLPFFKM